MTQQPEPLTESPAPGSPKLAGTLRRDDFLPHLKSAFQLDSGSHCTLIEVGTAHRLVSPTAEFTSFALLFAAPIEFAPDSKIYHLSHGQMGPLDLFLSPVGRSKEHVHLEAVFSQRA